jgi:hypothetical protein
LDGIFLNGRSNRANLRTEPLRAGSVVPSFRGAYLERFLHLVEGIDDLSSFRQREAVQRELEWCRGRSSDSLDQLRYQATLMVLRDLAGQGWRVQYRQRSIFLGRPDYSRGGAIQLDPGIVKAQIRDSMQEERLAKLCAPATQRFINLLERGDLKRKTILTLIRDGSELAESLRKLQPSPTVADLRTVVSPYLQLVEGETRDEDTGVRLIDVWRYFRYSWAIPYLATPGRNLFYLVRDSASAHHPVIGIAALGNSVVQLGERDRFIGWSVDGLADRLTRRSRRSRQNLEGNLGLATNAADDLETEEEYRLRVGEEATRIANCLTSAVAGELSLISLRNLAKKSELARPHPDLIQRLLKTAAASEHERRQSLLESDDSGRQLKRTESLRAWQKDSESPLYRRKRAQVLADLLFARQEFAKECLDAEPLPALTRLLAGESGRKALRIALHANKKTRIGSNMMDIIVCGAVPPYGEMLGGKLVAMLMASPQVLRDYEQRYGGQPSEITSRLAGRPIVRPADLVFLGTTSLYHVGSSQYERIKIPVSGGGTIAYERIGYTEGYGSTVLSGETTAFLRELVVHSEGMRRVNNVFGEGVSPRLRMIRDGLAAIGIPQDVVLRHSCPRIIYGVSLARNTMAYLRGENNAPEYYFQPKDHETGTRSIVDFWLDRWLRPRSQRPESLAKLTEFSKQDVLLSKEFDRAARMPRPLAAEMVSASQY